MRVAPVVLEGRVVRLEPLEPRHLPALHRQVTKTTFEHYTEWPADDSLETFSRWVLRHRSESNRVMFAVVLRESGEPVGSTSFLDIRPAHFALEIGSTWYGPAHQGTAVNPEAKRLLMAHAFEELGCVRVQLKTSSRNLRSQRAMEKLGAVKEGVLRNFQMRQIGLPRDTVLYSVTGAEWPTVRAGLDRRLGMDGRTELLALLHAHVAADEKERADLAVMRERARTAGDPFSREEPGAHFTGSAVVMSADGARVCLVHHGKLHRWLQPGGHAEPSDLGSMALTALREAHEETGMRVRPHPRAWGPLDVDAHTLPARKADAEHLHLDVRYAVVADEPETLRHDPAESHGAKWLSLDDALALADEAPLRRMLEKARALGPALSATDR
jgi:RimJ/RimL family protein N-acetyltransferase/8-oxo-dGTP pyrophosphatase MutT (NUDIX family)